MSTPLADKVAELERALQLEDDAATFWRERAEKAEATIKRHAELCIHGPGAPQGPPTPEKRLHFDHNGYKNCYCDYPPEPTTARTWTICEPRAEGLPRHIHGGPPFEDECRQAGRWDHMAVIETAPLKEAVEELEAAMRSGKWRESVLDGIARLKAMVSL